MDDKGLSKEREAEIREQCMRGWKPQLSEMRERLDALDEMTKERNHYLSLVKECEEALGKVEEAVNAGECREDEDCDHCYIVNELITPCLAKISGETKPT